MQRARSNELEGLLADTGSGADTDADADAMSLHSNIGSRERRRKKKRGLKSISLFGWNLFGKSPGAIQLPDDGDDALARPRPRITTPGALSSSTLDSDAAPLDADAIADMRLSSAQLDARAAAVEAEDKRLKQERRQLRRERKELDRAAKALALAAEGQAAYAHTPTPPQIQNYQPQAQPPPGFASYFTEQPGADPDSDDADLGGQLYARRAPASGHSNSDGSASRSRTSASQSNPDQYQSQYLAQLQGARHNPSQDLLPPRKSKTRSSKSKSSKSHSSSATSQSPSLASPATASFPTSPLPNSPLSGKPREGFEGFPMDGAELGFPSPGFGGGRAKVRDMGAFLADRGDTRA